MEQIIQDMEAGKEIEKAYYVPERCIPRRTLGRKKMLRKVFLVEDETVIREGLRTGFLGSVRIPFCRRSSRRGNGFAPDP